MLTREEALLEAVKMRDAKVPYPKIEEHFKKIGYVSEKTGKPLKHLAIRAMVEQFKKEERDSEPKFTSPEIEAIEGLKSILVNSSITPKMRMKMAKIFLEEQLQA